MNYQQYAAARNELAATFTSGINIEENETLSAQFNLVSAGLLNYLPQIEFLQHETIYREVLLHQQLSILDQCCYDVLNDISYEHLTEEIRDTLKNKPAVICTFHTGSYRAINLFLTKNKIPYSLVIAGSVLRTQGALFTDLYKALPGDNKDGAFRMIDAEATGAGLQMLRTLKEGKCLLVYMDGNIGSGTDTAHNSNACLINFLHCRIFARKGIAFLAHAAGVPVLPVMSYRKSITDIRLRFFDPIYPDKHIDRSIFAELVTQQLYKLAGIIIQAYPQQWEGWLYLHKVACITESCLRDNKADEILYSNKTRFHFNSAGFGIFNIEGTLFLFGKANYSSYPIDESIYAILSGFKKRPALKKDIDPALFLQLYRKGVIVPE